MQILFHQQRLLLLLLLYTRRVGTLTGTSEPAAAAAADRWTDGMRDGGAHGPLAGTDDGLLPGPFARQESLL
jgi:hypothetical protein